MGAEASSHKTWLWYFLILTPLCSSCTYLTTEAAVTGDISLHLFIFSSLSLSPELRQWDSNSMTATEPSCEPISPPQEDPGRPDGLVRGAATKIVDLGTKTTRWEMYFLPAQSPVTQPPPRVWSVLCSIVFLSRWGRNWIHLRPEDF